MSDEQEQLAAMNAVFGEEPTPEVASDPEPEPEIVEEPAPDAYPVDPEPEPNPEPTTAPEYITKSEYTALQEQFSKMQSQYQEEVRRLHGKYGELHREVQQRPSGVKLSADKLKRLRENFPELAEHLAEDLSEALEISGQSFGESQARQLLEQQLSQATNPLNQQVQTLKLTIAHPDWRKATETPEWNNFVSALPAADLDQLRQAHLGWDADTIAGFITRFKSASDEAQGKDHADAEAAKAKAAAKSKVIQAAVTPAGSKAPMPATNSELDAFLQATQRG